MCDEALKDRSICQHYTSLWSVLLGYDDVIVVCNILITFLFLSHYR